MMTKKGIVAFSFFLFLISTNAHAITVFYEDWDGNGPGIGSNPAPTWTLSGDVLEAGAWGLYSHNSGTTPNLTSGNGRYAGVISNSFEFIDTWAWLTSPIIDVSGFDSLVLSADVYFRSFAASPGEDTVPVSIIADGGDSYLLDTLGTDRYVLADPISGRLSWDLSGIEAESIQIMFGWYSSWGPADYRNIQIENITLTGNIQPVPEPATMVLVALGFLVMGAYCRRRETGVL